MIEVDRLTKHYGPIVAVEDVSFTVGQGEIIGFLGPNGAGKSTTMRVLTGFTPSTRGTARIAGFDVHEQPLEVKRRVGYLPERVPLYEEMLVESFLRYVAEVKGVPRARRRAEIGHAMERCGLAHMAGRMIRNLSKGYRQRVGLAQALVGSPPVLILDEPTVGLDPAQIVEIRQMIRGLASDHTVLLSTHILPEVSMVCERVIIINRGRVVAEDRMDALAGVGEQSNLIAEIEGPAGEAKRLLASAPGVLNVVEEAPGRYRVEGAPGQALGQALSKAIVEAGLGLRRLEAKTRTLEDVFMEAVAKDAPASGGAENAA